MPNRPQHEIVFTGEESLGDLNIWRDSAKFAIGSVFSLEFDADVFEFNMYFDKKKSCWCVEDTVTNLVTHDEVMDDCKLPPTRNLIKLHCENLNRELILSYGQSLHHQIELRDAIYEASNWYEHKQWLWRSAREDAMFLNRQQVIERSFLSYYEYFSTYGMHFPRVMEEMLMIYGPVTQEIIEDSSRTVAEKAGEKWDALEDWRKMAWRLNTRANMIKQNGGGSLTNVKALLAKLGRPTTWERSDNDVIASCLLHDFIAWNSLGKRNPYVNEDRK